MIDSQLADDLKRATKRRNETLAEYLRHSAGDAPGFPSNGTLHAYAKAEDYRKERDRIEERMLRDARP